MELASEQVAPQLCCALARLCGQATQGGRAFATHIFKECMPHASASPSSLTSEYPLACTGLRVPGE